jgi:arylsulfatase A-like enzyme
MRYLLPTLLCLLGCSTEPARTKPKHVIFISIDTLRQDHVGLYGYERDTTPVLDEFAKESLVFDRAYTTWTWTLIAHMGLLTGLHASQHGVWKREAALSEDAPLLAERLADEGFYSAGFHFPGWLDKRYGFDRGFDVYESHKNAEEADEHMRAALAARPKEKPVFLFMHLFDVHNTPLPRRGTPYTPPAPFDEMFLPGAKQRLEQTKAFKLWQHDGSEVGPEEHEAIVALYDGGVRYIDTKLGEWLEFWKSEGILDDALVIITSDHGEGLYQRGERYGGHGACYEEGLVVPLVIRFPGGRFAGDRVSDAVSHVDLVPTILDVMQIEHDASLPGYSLLHGRPDDALIVAEHPRLEAEVLYLGDRKLVRSPQQDLVQAIDLASDAGELAPHAPLSAEFDALELELEVRASEERARWSTVSAAAATTPVSEETEAHLDALGYGGDGD